MYSFQPLVIDALSNYCVLCCF